MPPFPTVNSRLGLSMSPMEDSAPANEEDGVFSHEQVTFNLLRRLGTRVKADRAYLIHCSKGGFVLHVQEWKSGRDVESLVQLPSGHTSRKFIHGKPAFIAGIAISKVIKELRCQPSDCSHAVPYHRLFAGVASSLLLPIFNTKLNSEHVLTSIVGFDSAEQRLWSDSDERQLRTLSNLTSSVSSLSSTSPSLSIFLKPYTHALPSHQHTAELIAQYFETIRKRPQTDLWESEGRECFIRAVLKYVTNNQPVSFVLPAFPFKSPNKKTKVLGDAPDMAEKLALQTLHNFAETVHRIYPPGAIIVIVTDGRIFADVIGVDDNVVSAYWNRVKTLHPSPYLQFVGLEEFFPGMTHDQRRDTLMASYGSDESVHEQKLKTNQEYIKIYRGFRMFMGEDLCFPEHITSNKAKEKHVGAVTKKMLLRNEAFSMFVQDVYDSHIRLSIHAHTNVHKFGVNLIGQGGDKGTPWHNCAVRSSSGEWSLLRRNDPALSDATLIAENDLLYFQL